MNIFSASSSDLLKIKEILSESNLPVLDIESSVIRFFVLKNGFEIIGCIGIEIFENQGLLRSFAVKVSYQNQGLGSSLLDKLIEFCNSNRINTLHLLTNTAEKYFSSRGFVAKERNSAPISIQNTQEFSSIVQVLRFICNAKCN